MRQLITVSTPAGNATRAHYGRDHNKVAGITSSPHGLPRTAIPHLRVVLVASWVQAVSHRQSVIGSKRRLAWTCAQCNGRITGKMTRRTRTYSMEILP